MPPPRASQRPPPPSVRPPATAPVAVPSQPSGPGAAPPPAAASVEAATPSRTSGPGAGPRAEGPTSDELERAQRALDLSRKSLGRAEGKIKDLTKEAEALRDRLKQTERALDQKVDELEKFVSQHDSARSLVAVRAERIRELEAALLDHEREAAAERQRLAAEHEARIAELQDDMKRRLAGQELIITDLRTQIERFGTPRAVTDDL